MPSKNWRHRKPGESVMIASKEDQELRAQLAETMTKAFIQTIFDEFDIKVPDEFIEDIVITVTDLIKLKGDVSFVQITSFLCTKLNSLDPVTEDVLGKMVRKINAKLNLTETQSLVVEEIIESCGQILLSEQMQHDMSKGQCCVIV